MKSWHGAGVVGVALALGGCGGSPRPEAATPAEPVTAAPPPTTAELTPVEAPPGTFLRGRIKNPAQLANAVVDATALPLNWQGMLARRGPLFAEVVELESPVEVVMMLPPSGRGEPYGMITFGVQAEGVVLGALERLGIPSDEGGGGAHFFRMEEAECAVAPSVGPTAARIACADDREALDALLPYGTRGLPSVPLSDAALHLDVLAEPLRKAYTPEIARLKLLASMAARQLQLDSRRYDRAIAAVLSALAVEAEELIADADRGELQLRTLTEGDFEVAVVGHFRSTQSWTTQTIEELGRSQEAPPALYWELPEASSGASWWRTLPEKRTAPIWEQLRELLGGRLEHAKVGSASIERIEKWFADVAAYQGPVVSAAGPIRARAEADATSLQPGWHLMGIMADASEYRRAFDELSRALGSKDVQKVRRDGTKWLPELSKATGAIPGRPGSAVYEWQWHGELEGLIARAAGPMATSVTDQFSRGFVAIVPDGDRTWIAWAPGRDLVEEPFGLLASADTPRLQQAKGLEVIRETSAVAGGYFELSGLLAPLAEMLPPSRRPKSWNAVSQGLPYGGRVPATYWVRGFAGPQPRLEVVQRFPREFLGDLTAAVAQTTMSF